MLTITEGFTWDNGNTVMPSRLNAAIRQLTIQMAAKQLLGTTDAGNAVEIPYTDEGLALLQGDAADHFGYIAALLLDENLELSVLQLQMLRQNLLTGYPTSGPILINMSAGNRAAIALADDATFSVSGNSGGVNQVIKLTNATADSIALTWPAWTVPDGVVLPTSLAAGKTLLLRLEAFGTNLADVVACCN
jgi:hypothetical protein